MNRQTDWFPAERRDQLAMFTNIKVKINGYKNSLFLTDEHTERLKLICNTFIAVNNFVEQTHITARNVSDWQDLILTGEPKGLIPPSAPLFQPLEMPEGAFIGIFDEFINMIENIKSSRRYTDEIGEDLMIKAHSNGAGNESKIFPSLKVQTLSRHKVYLDSNLQGMDALRVEYRNRYAEKWQTIAFLTKVPAEFKITPTVEGEPEIGQLRAILMRNNDEVGQFSLDYPVILS